MELQEAYADIIEEGAELIALSTDTLADARAMASHAGATFPILADENADAARDWGIYDLLDDGVAAPAAFIVDGDLRLVGSYVGQSIADRLPASSIVGFLRELNGTSGSASS